MHRPARIHLTLVIMKTEEGIPNSVLCEMMDSVRLRSLVIPCPQQDFFVSFLCFLEDLSVGENITVYLFVDQKGKRFVLLLSLKAVTANKCGRMQEQCQIHKCTKDKHKLAFSWSCIKSSMRGFRKGNKGKWLSSVSLPNPGSKALMIPQGWKFSFHSVLSKKRLYGQ